MEELNRLFDKYEALISKFHNNPHLQMSHWTLSYLKNEIVPMCKNDPNFPQGCIDHVNALYNMELRNCLGQTTAHKELEADIKKIQGNKKKNIFLITVNFDDQTVTVPIMKEAHQKFLQIQTHEYLGHVFEKHRRDEKTKQIYIHHHIHYVVMSDYPKTKVLQFVFQKLKKYVGGINFIDVSKHPTAETAMKYIDGNKEQSKMECVEKDRSWRLQNNIS